MNTQGREGVPNAGIPGPRYLLATCGVVATAAYLGTEWLRNPLLGIPVGVWVIGVAQASGYALKMRAARRAAAKIEAEHPLPLAPGVPASSGWAGLDMSLAFGRVGSGLWGSVRSLLGAVGVGPARVEHVESMMIGWLDRWSSAPRAVRIGLDVGPELSRALRAGPTDQPAPLEWVPTPPGGDDEEIIAAMRLDARVRETGNGELVIVTAEADGRDGAWYDWSAPRPLTYGSVFPSRVDPSRITLAEINAAAAPTVRALAVTAAVLSRNAARLTLSDRLRGRTPLPVTDGVKAEDRCLEALARCVLGGGPATPALRAAARALSAQLASGERWIDEGLRRRAADAAAVVLADEPEAWLRAGTVRLAMGDDLAGLEALARAADAIHRRSPVPMVDHLAFLQAEVECGLPGPMTLGRVAAGICLVCATSPAERVPFIRADFMDDVRYSSWLVGRDQDRAVLFEVFKLMERGRQVERQAA